MNHKEPIYDAEVTYKWIYNNEVNPSKERYALEVSVDNGDNVDIIFCVGVNKNLYDAIEVGDSVSVALVYYGPSIGRLPVIKTVKKH
jgi:hypothetical protein